MQGCKWGSGGQPAPRPLKPQVLRELMQQPTCCRYLFVGWCSSPQRAAALVESIPGKHVSQRTHPGKTACMQRCLNYNDEHWLNHNRLVLHALNFSKKHNHRRRPRPWQAWCRRDASVVAHALTSTEVSCGELTTTTNLLREAAPADSRAMPRVP